MVQVFAQTGQQAVPDQRGSWDEDDMNGYQLLNEVGSGGTLSSLFTILSLFTEDVPMSWQDGEPEAAQSQEPPDILTAEAPIRNRMKRADSDVSQLDLVPESPGYSPRRNASASSATSTVQGPHFATPTASRAPSPQIHGSTFSQRNAQASTELHHGVVARATEDTTLAVIPAEAFRRLTKKFPKATGHIVQGLEFNLYSCRFSLPNDLQ